MNDYFPQKITKQNPWLNIKQIMSVKRGSNISKNLCSNNSGFSTTAHHVILAAMIVSTAYTVGYSNNSSADGHQVGIIIDISFHTILQNITIHFTAHLCGKFTGLRSLMFPLICAWINAWVNSREASDLRRHRAHYDVIVMTCALCLFVWNLSSNVIYDYFLLYNKRDVIRQI